MEMIHTEAWYRESQEHKVLRYLSDPVPYKDLPQEAKKAIIEYISEGVSPEEYEEHLNKYLFLFGEVPTEVLVAEIEGVMERGVDPHGSFEKYHRWYVSKGNVPDHSEENRWPVILSEYYEREVLQDGWHRFHDYYRKGHKTIPVVEFVKR